MVPLAQDGSSPDWSLIDFRARPVEPRRVARGPDSDLASTGPRRLASVPPTLMRPSSGTRLGSARRVHPHQWIWEPLEPDPTFVLRSMFGAKAVYLGGRIVLCFCAGEEPWRGVLVCTDRAHHAELCAEIPDLTIHPVLTKWLYLPERSDQFERGAQRLVAMVRQRDPRIGVVPKPKKKSPVRAATGSRPARKRGR